MTLKCEWSVSRSEELVSERNRVAISFGSETALFSYSGVCEIKYHLQTTLLFASPPPPIPKLKLVFVPAWMRARMVLYFARLRRARRIHFNFGLGGKGGGTKEYIFKDGTLFRKHRTLILTMFLQPHSCATSSIEPKNRAGVA